MDWPVWGQEFWLQGLFAQMLFALAAVLGVASLRYSRLALARAFPWFSLFALAFSVYIWVRLAQQIAGLSEVWLPVAYTVAFVFLGCAALHLFPGQHIRFLPRPGMMCMFLAMTSFLWIWAVSRTSWNTEQILRYLTLFLAFPTITATAYALRRHAQVHILPLQAPHLYRTLRIGGIALFLFGVLWLAASFHVLRPPMLWTLLQVLLLGVFAGAMVRGLEIFDVETRQRVEAMEIAQARLLERENVAREIHDHAVQNVFAASLMLESLAQDLPAPWKPKAERALQALHTAHKQLRGLLQRLNNLEKEGVIDVNHALNALVEEAARVSGAHVVLRMDAIRLTWEAQRAAHLLAFVREALSNAIRHARSPTIEVRVSREGDSVRVEVIDFGRGMPKTVQRGFGLRSMRDRALLLHGNMHIESRPGKGTRVTLTAPIRVVEKPRKE